MNPFPTKRVHVGFSIYVIENSRKQDKLMCICLKTMDSCQIRGREERMIRNILLIGLGCLLLFSDSHSRDRCSHKVRIKIIKPIHFDVMNDLEENQGDKPFMHFNISNRSQLIWHHPILDKKITVAISSNREIKCSALRALLITSERSDQIISIDRTDRDINMLDKNKAGLLQLQYISERLKNKTGLKTVAYTVTDSN